MRRVIIESPFAGSGLWPLNHIRRWLNIRYARRCVRDAVLRGESPIASARRLRGGRSSSERCGVGQWWQ